MQLHELKPVNKRKHAKRVGRGGKRGTYSGRGMKGQKSRAGARIRPGFRGGDNPIWKLFAKKRGASKKTDVKRRRFKLVADKPQIVNLSALDSRFQDGKIISPRVLIESGLIDSAKSGIKILGSGNLNKKLNFIGVKLSESAREKILKAGGTIK